MKAPTTIAHLLHPDCARSQPQQVSLFATGVTATYTATPVDGSPSDLHSSWALRNKVFRVECHSRSPTRNVTWTVGAVPTHALPDRVPTLPSPSIALSSYSGQPPAAPPAGCEVPPALPGLPLQLISDLAARASPDGAFLQAPSALTPRTRYAGASVSPSPTVQLQGALDAPLPSALHKGSMQPSVVHRHDVRH